MEAIFFRTLEQAIWSFAKNHKMYPMYPHLIKAGETFDLHHHKRANEWLCISRGKFVVYFEDEEQTFDIYTWPKCLCFFLPKGKKHTLRAKTDLHYFVFRDRIDRTVYDRKKKKRDRKKTR